MCFLPRGRCSPARSPIAGWSRTRRSRPGRPRRGRCGSARRNTSSPFRCARANSSTTSASCRPTRKCRNPGRRPAIPPCCGASSPAGTRASSGCSRRCRRPSAGRCMIASRCRPGRAAGSRSWAMPPIPCCPTSARARTRRSRTAWRSRPSSRAPTARARHRRSSPTSGCGASAVQRGARENGLRYDSFYADLAVRDAELAAHADFRRRLYDHDVVPDAEGVII